MPTPPYEVRLERHAVLLETDGRLEIGWRAPVKIATTVAGTLATDYEPGDTVDGVVIVPGDRILIKDLVAEEDRGIYVIQTTGAPERADDMAEGTDVAGAVVLVLQGTVNTGKVFGVVAGHAQEVGTSELTFTEVGEGVTDHGDLTGLADDDHSYYVKVVGGGVEGFQSHGSLGSTETIDLANGNSHAGTLTADCTFTFSGATSAKECSFVLELTEDGTGTWQPTWPGSVVWPGGSPPAHDDTAGSVSIYVFRSRDGGVTWYGFAAGATGSGSSFATPSITLGNTAAAGAASTVIRSDSTIEAFDDDPPTTIAYDDTPDAGAADFAARSDHRHGMASSASSGTHFEVLLEEDGSAPLTTEDGLDWLYVEVTD